MSLISNPGSEVGFKLALSGLLAQFATSARQPFAALAEINQSLKMVSIGVQFEFDEAADKIIAKVVSVETGKLIRQMPSEEVMQLSKVLGKLHGLLVHQAICRKAQLTGHSQAPAPTRWSNPWVTTDAPGQEAGAFRPV